MVDTNILIFDQILVMHFLLTIFLESLSLYIFFFSIKTQYHYKIHGLTTNYKLRATNKISASIRKECLFIVLGYASSIFWVSFCDLSL